MRRHLIACALILLYLPACTHWSVRHGSSLQQVIATEHPSALRVTLRDGSVVVLDQPRMASVDSVAGVSNGVRSAVAARDVTQVAVRGVNEHLTTAIFFGVAVAGIATLVAIQK